LTAFERQYSEFVRFLEEDRRSDFGSQNSAQLTRMRREILEATPRVEIAAKSSGHWLTTTNAPAMGGGVRSNSLTGQVMDIEEAGFMDDGLRIPRMILQAIPIQLGALKLKLEEVEKRKPTRADRREEKRRSLPPAEAPKPDPTPQQPWEHPVGKPSKPKRPWYEHPWVQGIGVAVIAGMILLLLGYLASLVF
jgi:hypothetical protein